MERVFHLIWTLSLALLFGCSPLLPDQVGDPGKELPRLAYLALMGFLLLTTPWICGPGMVKLLRGMDSGGVNLPHASYWFEGERRAASLLRFEPYLYELGVAVTLLLGAVATMPLWQATLDAFQPLGGDWALVWIGGLLLWLAVWACRVMRAFPRPPTLRPDLASKPSGPSRPGD